MFAAQASPRKGVWVLWGSEWVKLTPAAAGALNPSRVDVTVATKKEAAAGSSSGPSPSIYIGFTLGLKWV